MDCPKCGAAAPEGSSFCGKCGEDLSNIPAVEADSTAETAPTDKAVPTFETVLIAEAVPVVEAVPVACPGCGGETGPDMGFCPNYGAGLANVPAAKVVPTAETVPAAAIVPVAEAAPDE